MPSSPVAGAGLEREKNFSIDQKSLLGKDGKTLYTS
jgi:hypothetical protein